MSKNKLSGAIFLLLIILLSQSNILDMLFNTTLGRLSLVSLILGAGYLNKFMGIAAVLIAVVMFSSFGNVFEGFDDKPLAPENTENKELNGKELINNLKDMIGDELEKKKDAKITETKVVEETIKESFDIIGKERTLQLGMKSKHANNSKHSSGNVTPFITTDDSLQFSSF